MDLFDRDTLRLTLVNIGLGAACAVFLVIVARAIVRDLAERAESDATRPAAHHRAVGVTTIGVTMADGGEPQPPDGTAEPEAAGSEVAGSEAAGPQTAGPEARASRKPGRLDPSHLKRTIF